MPDESSKRTPARTFRLGPDADTHIAEIAAALSVTLGAPATDTAAVRHALAETAKMYREQGAGKKSKKTAK